MRSRRFLYSKASSPCCRHPTLPVRNRAGGFVSRNSLKCGKPPYVSPDELPVWSECSAHSGPDAHGDPGLVF